MSKKIIVFGATGSVGIQIINQALKKGYEVTAFARNVEKLKVFADSDLQVIQGDVFDADAVSRAIKGKVIVLCALGDGRKGIVRSAGTHNIIKGMKENGVKNLICQSTLGAGESSGNLNFFWKHIMFGWFLKKAFLDHEEQERLVKNSNLDWVIVRPGAFTNGALTNDYRHGFSSNDKDVKLKISRKDVASFMLDQINSNKYLHKLPGISY